MSKYTLVASYYDKYEKNSNLKYKNEVEVSLSEIDLSTLQAIDNFTSSHTYFEIFQLLEYEKDIKGKNHLAIKYQKNKTSKPTYYKVIENRKDFTPCTKDNVLKTYPSINKMITSLVVQNNNELFQKEKRKLSNIIEERNFEDFIKCFPYENSDLYHLVNRYINTDYDNDTARYEDYQKIMNEFSRYKTFRGWFVITNLDTPKKNITKIEKQPSNDYQTYKPIFPKTREYHEEEYRKNFEQQNNISYETYQTYKYNTSSLQDDKEEFLEEEEISRLQEQYDNFSEELTRPNIKRRHH